MTHIHVDSTIGAVAPTSPLPLHAMPTPASSWSHRLTLCFLAVLSWHVPLVSAVHFASGKAMNGVVIEPEKPLVRIHMKRNSVSLEKMFMSLFKAPRTTLDEHPAMVNYTVDIRQMEHETTDFMEGYFRVHAGPDMVYNPLNAFSMNAWTREGWLAPVGDIYEDAGLVSNGSWTSNVYPLFQKRLVAHNFDPADTTVYHVPRTNQMGPLMVNLPLLNSIGLPRNYTREDLNALSWSGFLQLLRAINETGRAFPMLSGIGQMEGSKPWPWNTAKVFVMASCMMNGADGHHQLMAGHADWTQPVVTEPLRRLRELFAAGMDSQRENFAFASRAFRTQNRAVFLIDSLVKSRLSKGLLPVHWPQYNVSAPKSRCAVVTTDTFVLPQTGDMSPDVAERAGRNFPGAKVFGSYFLDARYIKSRVAKGDLPMGPQFVDPKSPMTPYHREFLEAKEPEAYELVEGFDRSLALPLVNAFYGMLTNFTAATDVDGEVVQKSLNIVEVRRREAYFQECAAPTVDPPPGNFGEGVTLTMHTETEGGSIHYTLDGSFPSAYSPAYDPAEPILLETNSVVVVRAVTLRLGLRPSPVFGGVYNVARRGALPLHLYTLAGFSALMLITIVLLVYFFSGERAKKRSLYNNNAVAEATARAIAEMNLDEVSYLYDIKSPNRIQSSFIKIVDQLKELQSFIPHAVLVKMQESDNWREGEDCTVSVTSSGGDGERSRCSQPSVRSRISGRADPMGLPRHDSGQSADSRPVSVLHRVNTIIATPRGRDVVVLRISLRDLHFLNIGGVEGGPATGRAHCIPRLIETLAITCVGSVAEQAGVADFYGDGDIIATFNAFRPILSAANRICARACCAALEVKKQLSRLLDPPEMSTWCAAISSSRMYVGSVGCPNMRKMHAFGEGMSVVNELIRMTSPCRPILMDDKVHSSVYETCIRVFCDDFISRGRRYLASALVGRLVVDASEWMYELQEIHSANPFDKMLEQAWRAYACGAVVEARGVLAAVDKQTLETTGSAHVKTSIECLLERLDRQESHIKERV